MTLYTSRKGPLPVKRGANQVVGQPGSGKSTFLERLVAVDSRNYHINTDDFNHRLNALLQAKLADSDLISLAIKDEAKIKKIIVRPWFNLLTQALRSVPPNSNVFLEIPYGLQTDKAMWRFVGGKIIYVGCGDETINLARINARGTPQVAAFIKKIPDLAATQTIVRQNQLRAIYLDNNYPLEELTTKAIAFNQLIRKGE